MASGNLLFGESEPSCGRFEALGGAPKTPAASPEASIGQREAGSEGPWIRR
jgi:hypothetical protein